MPSRTTIQHSLQSTHLYIELSSSLQTELNHLKLTLQKNGHNEKNITKIINKHANKITVFDTRLILSIPPYIKGTIDRIGRILNKHNIRTIFKSQKDRTNLKKS